METMSADANAGLPPAMAEPERRWMKCFRIENRLGLHIRLGLAAILALFLAFAVRAAEIGQIVDKLPRGYIGEFSWDGDKTVQNVVIKFESVRALNEKNVEAVGC